MRRYIVVMAGAVALIAGTLAGCASDEEGPTGDPTLTALAIDLGPFNVPFDPAVTLYTISTGFPTLEATVTTADATEANASVSVNGVGVGDPVNLAEGRNLLNVRVVTTGGAVMVYTIEVTRGTEPNFVRQAYTKASNTGTDDHFGYSVALEGDTMVVGAPSEDSGINGNDTDNSAADAGAVYVFIRSGTTWTHQAYLKAANPGAGDQFGRSVALSGDTVIVGAPNEDSSATGIDGDDADNAAQAAGAAYVFVRSGTVWTQQAYLKASNAEAEDRFGWSVALSGDTAAVGALLEDSAARIVGGDETDDSAPNAGAAYVFVRSGVAWSQQGYIKASNADAGDDFGVSVAVNGDTLAVGASGESSLVPDNPDNNGARTAGAVYVFVRDTNGVWAQEDYLKAEAPGAADAFGWSLGLDGDTLAIGAPLEDGSETGVTGSPDSNGAQDSNGAVDSGAVYIFSRTVTGWEQSAYLKASNTDPGDVFGWRVALSGDVLAVGAPAEDSAAAVVDGDQTVNSAITAGAVYTFTGSGASWTQLDYVKAPNAASLDGFGGSVALDRAASPPPRITLAVGAIGEDSQATGIDGDEDDNTRLTSGAAYVFEIP